MSDTTRPTLPSDSAQACCDAVVVVMVVVVVAFRCNEG